MSPPHVHAKTLRDAGVQVTGQRLAVYDEQTRPLIEHYRAQGLLRSVDAQLLELRVTELARQQRSAILAEEIDGRSLTDEDSGQQQQGEPAKERARPQPDAQAPAPSAGDSSFASSGTNTYPKPHTVWM